MATTARIDCGYAASSKSVELERSFMQQHAKLGRMVTCARTSLTLLEDLALGIFDPSRSIDTFERVTGHANF
jgi:hypothetical protein